MAHLVWSSELMTGIHEIDVQHQRIVQYINMLHDARIHHDTKLVGEVIDEAVDYTLSHFAFEESLMVDAGYPFSGPHKKVHELFTRKVAEMQARFQGGEDISEELHAMLSRWLFNHIRNDDGSYVNAVKTYLKMVSGGSDIKDQIKKEVLQEMAEKGRAAEKKGWFARLFS